MMLEILQISDSQIFFILEIVLDIENFSGALEVINMIKITLNNLQQLWRIYCYS